MNTKQLHYVQVLAKEGSFSKAAETLGISQPSLSQYIKNIEKEIGIALFERTNNSLRLTDAGKIYIKSGRKILDIEHQMENQFADISQNKTGTLIVGISPFRVVHLMPKVVAEFHKQYPGITLLLDERSGSDLIDSAIHGEFDLCITTLPVDERIFEYEIIQKEEVLLAVAESSSLYKKIKKNYKVNSEKYPVIDIKLLNNEDFCFLGEGQPMKIKMDEICSKYKLTLNKKIECRGLESLISMVQTGIGAAFVPSSIVDFGGKNSGIKYFKFEQVLPFRDIVVMWQKDQYLSNAAIALKSLLQQNCK